MNQRRSSRGMELKRPPAVDKHPDWQTFQEAVHRRDTAPTSSWWTTPDRAEFATRAKAELPRMMASRFGQTVQFSHAESVPRRPSEEAE